MVTYLKYCENSSTIIVAASDSPRLDAADFVCSGTDDQADINSIIADLPAAGGRLYFLDGTYSIDSYTLDASTGHYYGIYVTYNDTTHCQIELEGETWPWWTNAVSDVELSGGARFVTSNDAWTGLDAETTAAIGANGYELGVLAEGTTYPGVWLGFKNIGVVLPDQKANHSGIDMSMVASCGLEKVNVYIDKAVSDLVTPPDGAIGIISPLATMYPPIVMDNCQVQNGFAVGFVCLMDQMQLLGCGAGHCATPFVFGGGYSSVAINCIQSCCIYGPQFISANMWDILGYVIEFYSAPTIQYPQSTFVQDSFAYESTPGEGGGKISYMAYDMYADSWGAPFWESGHGANFETRGMSAKNAGDTASRPTYPYITQMYYNSQSSKFESWDGSTWITLN